MHQRITFTCWVPSFLSSCLSLSNCPPYNSLVLCKHEKLCWLTRYFDFCCNTSEGWCVFWTRVNGETFEVISHGKALGHGSSPQREAYHLSASLKSWAMVRTLCLLWRWLIAVTAWLFLQGWRGAEYAVSVSLSTGQVCLMYLLPTLLTILLPEIHLFPINNEHCRA